MLVLLLDGILETNPLPSDAALPLAGVAGLLEYLGSCFPQGVGDGGQVHAGPQADQLLTLQIISIEFARNHGDYI